MKRSKPVVLAPIVSGGAVIHYFAYGSNMSLSRLAKRVGAPRRIGLCRLDSHDLRFHKTGQDGSGKCNAFETGEPGHFVLGSLFAIDPLVKPQLDQVEGLGYGYGEKQVTVIDQAGQRFEAFTYYATLIDDSLRPFSWYLSHVLIGARECGMPADYLERIVKTESLEDPDRVRDERERAIHRRRESPGAT